MMAAMMRYYQFLVLLAGALQLLAWFLYDPQPAAFFKPLMMHGWLTGWLLLNNLISQELASIHAFINDGC